MALSISQKLNDVRRTIFIDREAEDATVDDWVIQIQQLFTQISIQKPLALIAKLVRQGRTLPARKMSFNVKILSQNSGTECGNGQSRWTMLQELGCEAVVFCALAVNAISTLPSDHFAWLVENGRDYMEAQGLPYGWIAQEQIRKVVAGIPMLESTKSFLKGLFNLQAT